MVSYVKRCHFSLSFQYVSDFHCHFRSFFLVLVRFSFHYFVVLILVFFVNEFIIFLFLAVFVFVNENHSDYRWCSLHMLASTASSDAQYFAAFCFTSVKSWVVAVLLYCSVSVAFPLYDRCYTQACYMLWQ